MSNIGKSYLATRLVSEKGFERIGCDDLVETAIGDELKQLGYSGVNDVGRWMGQPYTANYSRNSAKFIECERAVMLDIIARLKLQKANNPLVIDTSGSVIYVGEDVIQELKTLSKIVYLEASELHREKLFKLYIDEPKPVVWGESYSRLPGESDFDSLARTYPLLLNYRTEQYKRHADLTIPYETHRGMDLDFLLKELS